MLLAGPKIAKCAQEPGALGHLDQEFGDPHARKQGVEPAIESLRLGWSDRRHGLQLEPVAFERHAREPVRLELLGETAQPPVERPCPLLQRSEEHTSELQSLMRISYAVFCLKKKKATP